MALKREEVARRYSAALFAYTEDQKVLDQTYNELEALDKAVKSNPGFLRMMSDPLVNSAQKRASLKAVEGNFSDEIKSFLDLLLDYQRLSNLLDIISDFNHLYDLKKKIATGSATTAIKLDADQLKKLGQSYADKYHLNNVRLTNRVDPTIIGGVILHVGDRIIDGSVQNRLEEIRKQLNKPA